MSVPLALLNELMGIVPNASDHGPNIDHFLEFCHWFMLALFLGWGAFFLYTIFRFHRSRNPVANYHGVKTKASAHIEFVVVVIEAVLLLGFALPLWGRRVADFPDKENALRVRAVGEQFAWNFHYPGPDGVFGKTAARLVTGQNPVGIDPIDPAGKDDFVSKNDLQIINYRPTVIDVTARDVIHSFSVHHMRIDQDANPGMTIPLWFRPTRAGSYEIVCAQLCGGGHSGMKAIMNVVNQAEFDTWASDTLKMQRPDYVPPGQAAAPAPPGTTAVPASSGSTPATPGAPAPAAAQPGTPAPGGPAAPAPNDANPPARSAPSSTDVKPGTPMVPGPGQSGVVPGQPGLPVNPPVHRAPGAPPPPAATPEGTTPPSSSAPAAPAALAPAPAPAAPPGA